MNLYLFIGLLGLSLGSITVFAPSDLQKTFQSKYDKGIIPSSMGNFGNPPYGSFLTGQLIIEDKSHSTACDPLPPMQGELANSGSQIVMANAGDCAFVVKVRNAQDIGAKAVIIVNDDDSDINKFIMTDNGAGGNLDIPAFIIRQEDGNLFYSYKSEERITNIILCLGFEINKSTKNEVSVTIWLQSSSDFAMTFLNDFSIFATNMPQMNFTPHYLTWECQICKQQNFVKAQEECISAGRYCSYDPDGYNPIKGQDVVLEDLTELCVFNVSNTKKWFNYISEFYKNCYLDFSRSCSNKVLKTVGVIKSAVDKCIKKSIEGDDLLVNDNRIMRNEFALWNNEMIPFNPAIIINNMLYRGDLEVDAVSKAICASFTIENIPDICKVGVVISEDKSKGNFWIIILLLLVIALVISILAVYRIWLNKELKHDIRLKVGAEVAQYFQMADLEKN
ncbi:hypothetical protein SteCoe_18013 [Stentor coeruleus]|uniref:Uncharacterized protein n=1 Tax=Stentor coeruleus TaxID=5963 RepID=A0A1R2BXZ2_9CILI|nr:hypothetical protein SteCoe_18013 [Stentor coeruleus]